MFTRSDAVRVTASLLWFALSLGLGLYDSANLPMLTVMVFLPAAFAFAFRAWACTGTEDPVRPHKSVQAAAASALCFIPVMAAEPQLLLPLVVTFLVFFVFVRRHRATLLLIRCPPLWCWLRRWSTWSVASATGHGVSCSATPPYRMRRPAGERRRCP